MKNLASFRLRFSLLLLALSTMPGLSTARAGSFSLQSWYQGGEADTTPTNDGTVATAVNSSGSSFNMTANGSPTWSANVAPAANLQPAVSFMGFDGTSTFSYNFNGGSSFSTTNNSTTATENFGIEVWVNPLFGGSQLIFYNGNSSTDGYGLVIQGGTYKVLLGGSAYLDTGMSPLTEWTEFAYVNVAGVNEVYLDGVLNPFASGSTTIVNAITNGDGMSMGANGFQGNIDEARLFTFSAGTFNAATDLNYVTPVPEPGTWGLLGGLGALGLAVIRKRR